MNRMVKDFFKTKDNERYCSIDFKNEELKVEKISPNVTVDSKDSPKRAKMTNDGSRLSIESQNSLNLKPALKRRNSFGGIFTSHSSQNKPAFRNWLLLSV